MSITSSFSPPYSLLTLRSISAVRSFPRTNLKARFSSKHSSVLFPVNNYDKFNSYNTHNHNQEGNGNGDFDDDDSEGEEGEDGSLDLMVRVLSNVFRKVSKRARRAVRAVLPDSIPTKLVRFSVNGVLILAFLWILKGLLEVVCTFGSMVFFSILLVRGIWSGITYIKENRYYYINRIDNDEYARWNDVQPVS